MAIAVGTPTAVRASLGDVVLAVRERESECSPDERAWVECRQLTEGEEAVLEGIKADWQIGRSVNLWRVREELVFMSLTGAGNLTDHMGKELFRFTAEGLYGGKERFIETWRKLPTDIAEAITRIAIRVNPRQDTGNLIRVDPMLILAQRYPEIAKEVVEAATEAAEKKFLPGSTVSWQIESSSD